MFPAVVDSFCGRCMVVRTSATGFWRCPESSTSDGLTTYLSSWVTNTVVLAHLGFGRFRDFTPSCARRARDWSGEGDATRVLLGTVLPGDAVLLTADGLSVYCSDVSGAGLAELLFTGGVGGFVVVVKLGRLLANGDGELGGRVEGELGGRAEDEVGDRAEGQLGCRLYGELGGRVDCELGVWVDGELGGRFDGKVGGRIEGQLGCRVDGELGVRVNSELGGRFDGKIVSLLDGELVGVLDVGIAGVLDGEIVGVLDGEIVGQIVVEALLGNLLCVTEIPGGESIDRGESTT